MIIAAGGYFSFGDEGLIEKLRWDNRYAFDFTREKQFKKKINDILKETEKQKKAIAKTGLEKGRVEGEINAVKNVALRLLKEGVDREVVQKTTGLSPQHIGRIVKKINQSK